MTTNYHTPWVDGTSEYKEADMGAPLEELDEAVTALHVPKYYDHIGQYLDSKPNSGALLMRGVVSRYMVLEGGAARSEMYAGTLTTNPAVFTIQRNGQSIGTITMNPGHPRGAFSVATPVAFYSSDVLELVAPNPQDATLENISWNIVLMRPDIDLMTTTTTTTQTSTSTTTTTV